MADLSAAQSSFVQTYGPLARDVATQTGLDPSVVLGQIAQETGWGAHVSGNNLFGISPGGKVAGYPDVQTAANDYVRLIRSRYADAAAQPTPEGQAAALVRGGYNTVDPKYTQTVSSLASTVRPSLAAATAPQRPSDDDLAQRWGVGAATAPAPAGRPSDDDLAKQWGAKPQNDNATSDNIPTVTVLPQPSAPATQPDYTGWDQPTPAAQMAMHYGTLVPGSSDNPLSYKNLTHALAPAPNTTYGNVLPLARDNATGQLRMAMPQAWRSLAQGGVDLAYGPETGTVTPEGTGALGAVAGQVMPSVARGTGVAIAGGAAGRPNPLAAPSVAPAAPAAANPLASAAPVPSNAPAFVPPGTPAPLLGRITALIDKDNEIAANKPAFIPPTTSTSVTGEVTPIRQPRNPLSTEAAAPETNPLNTTAPETAPAASIAAPAVPPLQEAAEYAAIPEALPPAPKVPPLTLAQGGARADQLIKHFASRSEPPVEQDLVPGFVPTLAQVTNDPGIATLERGVQAANPGAFGLRKETNQSAIRDFTTQLVGTPADVSAAQAEREMATAPLREAAFANKTDVDAAPVEQQIDSILSGPDGKRAAVRNTLQNVQKSLHVGEDTSAPLETDPEQLYGVRKHINDMLSPVSQRDNPELQRASGVLSDIKNHLDTVIEKGAPGFQDYITKYADMSRPIDEKQYLQGLNLTDQDGNVRGASVDTALKTIAKLQQAPGVNKAGSISDETMAALQRLQNTLRVQRFADTAGKAIGSNTFQNLATNSTVGAVTGSPLTHIGMSGLGGFAGGGPVGAMVGAGLSMGAQGVTHRAENLVRQAMIERLLNLQGKGVAALGAKP